MRRACGHITASFLTIAVSCAPAVAPSPTPLGIALPCVSAASVASLTPPAPAPAATDPCAKIAAEQRRHLASLGAEAADGGVPAWVPPIFTRCYRSKKGAWGLSAEFATYDHETHGAPEPSRTGNWYVSHVDASGVLATRLPFVRGKNNNLLSTGYPEDMAWKEPVLFDFDGDGEDEFLVTGTAHVEEGSDYAFAQAWAVGRKGSPPWDIVEYELRGTFHDFYDVVDFDGDGRPDLVTHGHYEAPSTRHTCSAYPRTDYGPPLLAHSLANGTFSSDDAVAERYALRSCPRKPASLLDRPRDGTRSDEHALLNVVCARMWGESEAEVVQRIKIECGLPAPKGACVEAGPQMIKEEGPIPRCSDAEGMLRWAKVIPLVRLKP